jgi:hypothetical protein
MTIATEYSTDRDRCCHLLVFSVWQSYQAFVPQSGNEESIQIEMKCLKGKLLTGHL